MLKVALKLKTPIDAMNIIINAPYTIDSNKLNFKIRTKFLKVEKYKPLFGL